MTSGSRALAAVPDNKIPQPPKDVAEGHDLYLLHDEWEGHWVEYRKIPTSRELIASLRANEDFAAALEAAASRISRHSFGGDIIDQDVRVLTGIVNGWTKREEAQALDPTSAAD